jgi:transcriptional regulator with GAF, ATPase, and Fis domain
MGKRMLRLFEEADGLGGLVARMRLASLAQLTSTEAESHEDRPELVQRVQAALDEVKRQFPAGGREDKAAPSTVQVRAEDDHSHTLRRHLKTYLDMMSQRSLFLGDAQATIRRVNEAATSTLGVQRVSVWYCDPEKTKIWCVDLFERDVARHSAGAELFARDFSPYFRALRSERTIAAHDAHVDPRTSCFSKVYLEPLGITSLLDVPIWLGRKMVGVVCHEHVGPKRFWTKDEETFAYLMSNFVALALERGTPAVL